MAMGPGWCEYHKTNGECGDNEHWVWIEELAYGYCEYLPECGWGEVWKTDAHTNDGWCELEQNACAEGEHWVEIWDDFA